MQTITRLLNKTNFGFRHISQNVFMRTAVASQQPTTADFTAPIPDNIEGPADPKLVKIVTEISHLNLLEVSELSKLLKKTLNLPDAMPAMAFGPAPTKTNIDEDEQAAPKTIQTSFKVKLMKFDEKQKVPLIKEIKNLLEGMNLVQAKKFVESAPTIVKEDIPKDEAEKLKEALAKVGAIIEIE